MNPKIICNDELTVTVDGDDVIITGTGEEHTHPPDHDVGTEIVDEIRADEVIFDQSVMEGFDVSTRMTSQGLRIQNRDAHAYESLHDWDTDEPVPDDVTLVIIGGNTWSH